MRCKPCSSVTVAADLEVAPTGVGRTAARNETGISALRAVIIFSIPTSVFARSRREQRIAGPMQFLRAERPFRTARHDAGCEVNRAAYRTTFEQGDLAPNRIRRSIRRTLRCADENTQKTIGALESRTG